MRHLIAGLLLLSACAGAGRQEKPATTSGPAAVSRAQLQGLRWLEGRWATERNAYLTTYMEFSFTSDTSLQVRLYESRRFQVPYNAFTVVLEDGRLRARSGTREWIAMQVDSTGMHLVATGQDVYEALGISRIDEERARLHITWRFESGEVERRRVAVRRVSP
jgi:hypothetical protein